MKREIRDASENGSSLGKCKVCSGTKLVKSETAPVHIDCYACNGTGKENAK